MYNKTVCITFMYYKTAEKGLFFLIHLKYIAKLEEKSPITGGKISNLMDFFSHSLLKFQFTKHIM